MSAASDEARLVADSAADFAAGHGGAARARRFELDGALDIDCWRGMAALGWFGIAVPEHAGGLGLGAGMACLVAEAAGRALLAPPLTTAVAAASLLAESDEAAARDAISGLLDGSQVVVFGLANDDDGRRVPWLADLDIADTAIVGRGAGDAFEARRLATRSGGVRVDSDRCVDGSSLGVLHIDRATWTAAPTVLAGITGEAAWQRAVDLQRLLDAAALCGLADAALAMALAYLRQRRQFGVPIGSFQALQHRAVDCHVLRTSAAALVGEAARADPSRASWAASAAVRVASRAALQTCRENIQFHGGIGFADEHDAGLHLRRAMVWAARHRR